MPHWWMRKRGRPGRAVAAGPLWEPFPSSRRRVRGAVCDPDRRRQRERATPPVAAARRAARTQTAAARAVGRPRLRRRGAPTAAARTRRRTRDQPTATTRRTRTRRRRHTRLPRRPPATQDARPARPQTLARRTHKQLAAQLATRLHPLGTTTRPLARRHPNRGRAHNLGNHPTLIALAPPDTSAS